MRGSTGDNLYTEPDPTPWLGRRMTPEEFLALPEFKPYLELFEGVVVQKAYADPTHGLLQPELTRELDDHAQARRVGMAFLELTTCFARSVVIPDVAYVRADRLPIDSVRRRFRREHVRTPDLAAEIMHLGQRRASVARRCRWYVENGVLVSLLVDPNDDTVEVFRPGRAAVVLRGDDPIQFEEVLPGFSLTVRSLFARTYDDWWGTPGSASSSLPEHDEHASPSQSAVPDRGRCGDESETEHGTTMAISEQQAISPYVGRRMSLDEFLALPEQEPALEFEDGMVTQKVSPKRFHGRGQFKLGQELGRAGEDTGIGQVFTEIRFKSPGWAPVPDISFYRMERITPLPDDVDDDFDVPPDIAVEVSSPDQSVGELVRKCLRYAALGVPISVLVAIQDWTVFVFRPGQETLALRGVDRIDLSDVLPAFDLTVDGLFALIRPERPHPNS